MIPRILPVAAVAFILIGPSAMTEQTALVFLQTKGEQALRQEGAKGSSMSVKMIAPTTEAEDTHTH